MSFDANGGRRRMVDAGFHGKRAPEGGEGPGQAGAALASRKAAPKSARSIAPASAVSISSLEGQMSSSETDFPSGAVKPSSRKLRFASPANANAITSGGDMMKARSSSGWMRPGKLRLPESTATRLPPFAAGSGPEVPIQMVTPKATK